MVVEEEEERGLEWIVRPSMQRKAIGMAGFKSSPYSQNPDDPMW